MPSSRATTAPLVVLLVCAPADLPAAAVVAQRLRADGMQALVAGELSGPGGGSPRALREALGRAQVVLCCLSRRSWDAGQLVQPLAGVLELLPLIPDAGRALLTLRLAAVDPPEALQHRPAVDLFSASGYRQLLEALRAQHAELITALPPEPEPEPVAPAPLPPALALSGGFGLPALDRLGQVRRLGRGVARALFLIDSGHALVISGGGPALVPLDGGAPRWAIDCPTRSAALSPSGRLLALASGNQILLWSLLDGRPLGVCAGHSASVSGVAFAPDERTLVSAAHDRSVRLWRLGEQAQAPTPLATIAEHADAVASVAVSPDGALIAAGGADRTVRVWRSLDRSRVQLLSGLGGAAEALAFSPDGRMLAAGSRGRMVRVWDTASWRVLQTLEGHQGAVEALAFSPDGGTLASGSSDRTARLWRVGDGSVAATLARHEGAVIGLAFSPDGGTLATIGEDDRLLVWAAHDGSARGALRPFSSRVSSMALSGDGATLAVGAGDGTLALHGLDGALRRRVRGHQGAVTSAAFVASAQVVTAGTDRSVRTCRLDGEASTLLLQAQGAVQGVSLAPSGKSFASFDAESTVQLWRIAGDPPAAQFWRVLRGLRGRPRRVVFDPRGETVAVVTDDGGISLWQLTAAQSTDAAPARTVTLQGGPARSLAFSADGSLLAAGAEGGALQLWQTRSGAPAASLQAQGRPVTALAFSADGRALAAGDAGGTLLLWRLALGADKRRQAAPAVINGHAGAVEQVAFTPAGGTLVSGSADGTVRIWKL